MKKKNTITVRWFVWEHIWIHALSIIYYNLLLFKPLPNFTYDASKNILWIILLSFSGIGFALCYKQYRSEKNARINVLLGYEVYTLLAYAKYFPIFVTVTGVVTLLCLLFLIWATFARKIKQGADTVKVLVRRLHHALTRSRVTIAYCFLLFCLPLTLQTVFNFSIFESIVSATNASATADGDANTIANNIEVLAQLEDDIWATLTLQEKIDVMQVAANVEAHYLGLNHELNVVAEGLEDDTNGYYSDTTHHISLNITLLEEESGYECLETLCHEAYHAYQHRQVDVYNQLDAESQNLLMFYEISYYKEEFEGEYEDGSNNWYDYYTQYCETYARAYAADSIDDYYAAVQSYWDAYDIIHTEDTAA